MRPATIERRHWLYLQARATIVRHYDAPLTQAMVAKALASSPRQIGRVYAQFDPQGFHEDLLRRRLTVAARLLVEQPQMPVREVASRVGFRQAPHFAKAFRRRYGLTPMRFRAQARPARSCRASRAARPVPRSVGTGA
jgi:transcriptional regulator GlxA family with amidase domain